MGNKKAGRKNGVVDKELREEKKGGRRRRSIGKERRGGMFPQAGG